ncbi:sushi, von Willebrand factor type A, EGF and pentraxin domain-containing protein 1-like [Clavelina lepadiformis]|uniref:Cubilin n=1 Tax=Clavelina lepadiformis TaxID=159417 RepID=A0ABP0FPG7_CLALP
MKLKLLVLLHCVAWCYSFSAKKNVRWKRSPYDLPESKRRIACAGSKANNNKIVILCEPETSVYIVSAEYGRSKLNNVCGYSESQEICASSDALERARSKCIGKRKCDLIAADQNMGIPLKEDGAPCSNTNNYLSVYYRCVPDCQRPKLNSGVAMIGVLYSVNSSLAIRCRPGYTPESAGRQITRITCALNGTWIGGTAKCQDINECVDRNLHKCDVHANCLNTKGAYTCACARGYQGDGFSCFAVNADRRWQDKIRKTDYGLVTDANCGGLVFENGIKSPNYPFAYPNGANCQWIISVPPPQTIKLEFIRFRLEDSVDGVCERDKLIIYDGPREDADKWMATLCGDKVPSVLQSSTSQMRIHFKTDNEVAYDGFDTFFKGFSTDSECKNFYGPEYEGALIKEGSTSQTVYGGEVVILGCDIGYNMTDVKTKRICQNDNTWNDISNPCTAVRCGEPMLPEYPGVTIIGKPEDYRFNGPTVQYSCVRGYTLVNDPGIQTTIFCSSEGKWSNADDYDLPACDHIFCEVNSDVMPSENAKGLLTMVNGSRASLELGRMVEYGWEIVYSCNKGYKLVGMDTRRCTQSNGKEWSGMPVVCEEDNGIPGLTNFQIALIASILSGVVILAVGAGLTYCCVRDCRRKSRANRPYGDGKIRGQFPRGAPEFSYSTTHSRCGTRAKTNFPGHYPANYPTARSTHLPTATQPSAPSWEPAVPTVNIIPTSHLPGNQQQDWRRNTGPHQLINSNPPRQSGDSLQHIYKVSTK